MKKEIFIEEQLLEELQKHQQQGEDINATLSRLLRERAAKGVNTKTKMYTINEAINLLGCSRSTIFRKIKTFQDTGGRQGLGPVCRTGQKTLFIPESTISHYLKVHTGY